MAHRTEPQGPLQEVHTRSRRLRHERRRHARHGGRRAARGPRGGRRAGRGVAAPRPHAQERRAALTRDEAGASGATLRVTMLLLIISYWGMARGAVRW